MSESASVSRTEELADMTHELETTEVTTNARSFQARIQSKVNEASVDPCNVTASTTKILVSVKILDSIPDDEVAWGRRRKRWGRRSVLRVRDGKKTIKFC